MVFKSIFSPSDRELELSKSKVSSILEDVLFTCCPPAPAFDGFKIAQISDIHSGSFDSPEKVKYGVDLVNKVQVTSNKF